MAKKAKPFAGKETPAEERAEKEARAKGKKKAKGKRKDC